MPDQYRLLTSEENADEYKQNQMGYPNPYSNITED
jgi:hypothetical protein